MAMFKPVLAAALIGALTTVPAYAQRGREQDAAYTATKQGSVRSLRSIEDVVVPRLKAKGADYIGAEFDSQVFRYRLKFMRGSSVIWVDVDGRSGAIVGRAGD